MLNNYTDAASILNVSMYCDLLSSLGQDFADRFSNFKILELYVTFMTNLFMDVDLSEISGQIDEC
uniref:General transcription factor III repeat domaincontaining protein 2like [Acyrthosiphon pisum] n=2 Tax=Lepeophtheirus salmonis TaxID=72036 RepID=A0A0K2U6H7_LEPSM